MDDDKHDTGGHATRSIAKVHSENPVPRQVETVFVVFRQVFIIVASAVTPRPSPANWFKIGPAKMLNPPAPRRDQLDCENEDPRIYPPWTRLSQSTGASDWFSCFTSRA